MMGRPVVWTAEKQRVAIEHVLDEIVKGRAVTRILADSDALPAPSTWVKWLREVPELAIEVERARELGAATLLDEIVDIADDATGDVEVAYTQDGTAYAKQNSDSVARAKLRVYAREKYAQMIAPRKFGPKVDVTSGGEKLPAAQVTNDNRTQTLIQIASERAVGHTLPPGDVAWRRFGDRRVD